MRDLRRILIVDDHPVVTETLSALVDAQEGLEVGGVAGDAAEALELIRATSPDAMIVDISLNGTDGLELIKTARNCDRRLRILVLSRHEESVYGERALRAGAQGYLDKRETLDHVLEALRKILDGDTYFSEELKARLLRAAWEGHGDEDPLDRLSDRELEVFLFLGKGYSTHQVAERLHLSLSTVGTYRRHIRQKLDLESGREVVLYAVRWWDRQPT